MPIRYGVKNPTVSLNGANVDNVVMTSGATIRRMMKAITVMNKGSTIAVVKFFESANDTSASGNQIDSVPVGPGKTVVPLIVGQTLGYSQRLICTTNAATGDVIVSVSYDTVDQAE